MSDFDRAALRVVYGAIVALTALLVAVMAFHVGYIAHDTLGILMLSGMIVCGIAFLLHVADRIRQGQ